MKELTWAQEQGELLKVQGIENKRYEDGDRGGGGELEASRTEKDLCALRRTVRADRVFEVLRWEKRAREKREAAEKRGREGGEGMEER